MKNVQENRQIDLSYKGQGREIVVIQCRIVMYDNKNEIHDIKRKKNKKVHEERTEKKKMDLEGSKRKMKYKGKK